MMPDAGRVYTNWTEFWEAALYLDHLFWSAEIRESENLLSCSRSAGNCQSIRKSSTSPERNPSSDQTQGKSYGRFFGKSVSAL